MRLLQTHEKKVVEKEETIKILGDLRGMKKLLYDKHKKFQMDLDEGIYWLEKKFTELKQERENLIKPLYTKEKELKEKSQLLSKKEEVIASKEEEVNLREQHLKEMYKESKKNVEIVEKEKEVIEKLEENLQRKQNKFERHMEGQREFLRQNKDRLRSWLEKSKNGTIKRN